MINLSDLQALPFENPRPENFNLTEEWIDKISGSDPKSSSGNISWLSGFFGQVITWGFWIWLILFRWKLDWFGVIYIMPIGIFLCIPLGMLISACLLKRLEWKTIPNWRKDAYDLYRLEKSAQENKYLSAFEKMGIFFKSRNYFERWCHPSDVTEKWSELFYDDEINNSDIINSEVLPLPKDQMISFFKNEIFAEKLTGKDLNYLESLITNFVINLPRFQKIELKTLCNPITSLATNAARAEKNGIPVNKIELLKKIELAKDSKPYIKYNQLSKIIEQEASNNKIWIDMLSKLIGKSKHFDEGLIIHDNL